MNNKQNLWTTCEKLSVAGGFSSESVAATEIARAVRAGEQGSCDAADQFEADHDGQSDHTEEQQGDGEESAEQATEQRRSAARLDETAVEAKPVFAALRAGLLPRWWRCAVDGDDFDFERIAHGASVPRLRPGASGGCGGVWNWGDFGREARGAAESMVGVPRLSRLRVTAMDAGVPC